MCGKTYSIWKYLCKYDLNELSLDNIIDLERAVKELGDYVPVAGNVDPVEIIMNGTKEEIEASVFQCITVGLQLGIIRNLYRKQVNQSFSIEFLHQYNYPLQQKQIHTAGTKRYCRLQQPLPLNISF